MLIAQLTHQMCIFAGTIIKTNKYKTISDLFYLLQFLFISSIAYFFKETIKIGQSELIFESTVKPNL